MKVTPKREWHYPLALERQYSTWLVKHVEAIAEAIRRHLTAAPSSLEEVNRLMGDISRDMPSFTESRAAQMYQAVDRYNMTEWDAITKSVFGFPISTMPVKELVRQDIDEEALWVSENLDLITSIDAETLQKVKGELIRAIQDNVDRDIITSELTEKIRRIVDVEKNRAKLIANDQVGKLNGRLTMKRQMDAGITEFEWKSAGDSRVRPLHRLYNGHVYKWSKPPADGYPGYPIRCRCVALPVIDLDKVVVMPQKGRTLPVGEMVNAAIAAEAVSWMNNFKPKYGSTDTIELPDVDVTMNVKKVENSHFNLWTDAFETDKDMAVRLCEHYMREIAPDLPKEMTVPKIIILDFEKYGFGKDAISGYDSRSGVMYVNRKYRTSNSIQSYLKRNKGWFASTGEKAPYLHELGHRYHQIVAKKFAEKHHISLRDAHNELDELMLQLIHSESKLDFDGIMDQVSRYAYTSYKDDKTLKEFVAEAFVIWYSGIKSSLANKVRSLFQSIV